MRKFNLDEVRQYISDSSEATCIYIGADSERYRDKNDNWVADYTVAIVVHIDGARGCKIFGKVDSERDYDNRHDRPALRLMNEVYKIAELYNRIHEVLEERDVEVHLDINPNEMHGSSCVIQEAVGYIRGMCNVIPMVKPRAFAASYAADRLKWAMHRAA